MDYTCSHFRGESMPTLNKRSQIVTQGVQRSPNRAMLRAVGFKDTDFKKPIVGIANGYSTITPCNLGLNDLAMRAEAAAKKAGAMPVSYTHLRAHETRHDLVCRLLLEK